MGEPCTERSSFWQNFHHWLHWKLSFWQIPVQSVMKISSKWWHFRFSVGWLCEYFIKIHHHKPRVSWQQGVTPTTEKFSFDRTSTDTHAPATLSKWLKLWKSYAITNTKLNSLFKKSHKFTFRDSSVLSHQISRYGVLKNKTKKNPPYSNVSHRIVSYRIISYHIIYHIISYHISQNIHHTSYIIYHTSYHLNSVKTRKICHARDLWKLARYCTQLRLPCQPDPRNFPGTALLGGFQSSQELWNPLSKTVRSKCKFVWNKGPVNIWNDRKVQKYFGPVNIFFLILTLISIYGTVDPVLPRLSIARYGIRPHRDWWQLETTKDIWCRFGEIFVSGRSVGSDGNFVKIIFTFQGFMTGAHLGTYCGYFSSGKHGFEMPEFKVLNSLCRC